MYRPISAFNVLRIGQMLYLISCYAASANVGIPGASCLYNRWKKSTLTLSILFVIGWLATIGVAEWFYAAAEVEPPAWDSLGYSMKAFYFWQEITHGRFHNLLALVPACDRPALC